jgi:hypothetical protein
MDIGAETKTKKTLVYNTGVFLCYTIPHMIRKNEKDTAAKVDKRASKISSPLALGIAAILIIALVFLGKAALRQRQETTGASPDALVAKVAKHIIVKSDEKPTIATVQDPEALKKTNPFFYEEAQAGDRLLVWSDKAVLYSESRDRILSVLPIQLLNAVTGGAPAAPVQQPAEVNTAATSSAPTPKQEEPVTIEIRNGTMTPGLAGKLAEKLKAAGIETVLKPRDASTKDYAKTVVSRVSDKSMDAVIQSIIGVAKAELVELPTRESSVKGDILIIVGADFQP